MYDGWIVILYNCILKVEEEAAREKKNNGNVKA